MSAVSQHDIINMGSAQLVKVGQEIAILKSLGSSTIPSAVLNEDLKKLSTVKHENLNTFLGVCLSAEQPSILTQYASRGSLYDVLHLETTKLSSDVKQSLILDIALGMSYLHSSSIGK